MIPVKAVNNSAPRGWLAVGLFLLFLAGAGAVGAQNAPVGTYHSRDVTLELTSTLEARLSNRFGSLVAASYLVAGDTIVFRDESGPAACPTDTGRYLWTVTADTLRMRVVSDSCQGRRAAFSAVWTQGLPPASAAELTPVMITAQRRSEDAQRAPVAITVLSSNVLRDARVTQPQALTYVVPGLQIGSLPAGSALIFLRGVGNFAGTSLQDPTVTFNFDGVYIARQTATGGLFYDLERVEVLKGPQGTLYGRNATGGAVNILPRRPVPGVFGGEMAADYGMDNTVRVDGALNLPFGKRAAVRLAGQSASHNAYMTDGTDDQNDWAGRLSFRFDVNAALALRVVADYYDQGGHGPGSTPLFTGVENRFGVSSVEGGAYYGTQKVTIAGRNWLPVAGIQRANNQHFGFNTTIDWRSALGALTVVSASRASHIDALNTPAGNLLTVQEHSRQNSVEARLSSAPHPRLQTLIGAFYFDEDFSNFARPYNQFNVSLQRPESGVSSAAAFGRVTWKLMDGMRATLGARHTQERKYLEGSFESIQKLCLPFGATCPNAQPIAVDITAPPIPFPANTFTVSGPSGDGTRTVEFLILANESAKFSRTTWRSSLEYDVGDRALAYGSYETGFKSGGFFFSNDSQLYRPESIGALTLGLKSRLLDNRVQANVELFDWRYHDQQVSKISTDSKGATNLRTENIGQATIRGFDTSLEYLPLADTHLAADVQYLDATYDSYTFHTSQQPLSGCVVSPLKTTPPADFLVDCSGKRSPFAPVWTQAAEAAQTLSLQSASLTARTRVRHQSHTLTGLDFLAEQEQPAYWTVDASLTLSTADSRRSIGIFGQNLTDRTVMSNTFVVPFSTFNVGVLRPPRTLGVRVIGRF